MKECLNTNRLTRNTTRIYPISVRGYSSFDRGFSKFSCKKGKIYYFFKHTLKDLNIGELMKEGRIFFNRSQIGKRRKRLSLSEFCSNLKW